jgi:hypothetical protein
MPCSSGGFWRFRFAFAVLLTAVAVAPLMSQQPPDKPSGQELLENSIDRWNRMSPEERERELAKLPPARARLIRQRIRRYNQMNPDEQQALRERYQTFSQLPPGKQQVIRERLREFRLLPVARRPIVHGEVEQLRLLPEAERQAFLKSEDFRSKYSPQEQQIIRDLSTYLPN